MKTQKTIWTNLAVAARLSAVVLGSLSFGLSIAMAQPFEMSWYTMDGGGGKSNGGTFDLQGTVGQHDAGSAMTGAAFELVGGFWANSGSASGTLCANAGILIEGSGQVNDYQATCGSDDVRWEAHGSTFAFQITDPVVQFELTTAAPPGFGGTISVDVEASKAINSANLVLRARLFNFVTNSYVTLPGTLSLTTLDQLKNYPLPVGADPAEFVEPGTNNVRLLLQTIQTSGAPNVRTRLDEVLFNFE